MHVRSQTRYISFSQHTKACFEKDLAPLTVEFLHHVICFLKLHVEVKTVSVICLDRVLLKIW